MNQRDWIFGDLFRLIFHTVISKPLQSCRSLWLIYVVSVLKKTITFYFICPDWVWDAEIGAWWDVDDDSDGWERGVTRIEQESERDRIPGAVCFCWLNWQQDGSLRWEQWCVFQIPLWLCTLTRITCTTLTQKNELNRSMSTIRMFD